MGRKIVQDELKPGAVLPKVETWSESLGVSRTVVREALKGLAAKRLIKSIPKSGTIVCQRSDWHWWDSDVLVWASETEPNDEFLLQLTEIRFCIEPAAAEIAARKATNEDIENLTRAFQNLEQALGDEEAWVIADYEFHNSILSACRNELMMNLVQLLRKALLSSRQRTRGALSKSAVSEPYHSASDEVLERHRAIYQAICDRDPGLARQTMHDLLLRVSSLLEGKEK